MTGDIDSFGSLAMIDKKISPLWIRAVEKAFTMKNIKNKLTGKGSSKYRVRIKVFFLYIFFNRFMST